MLVLKNCGPEGLSGVSRSGQHGAAAKILKQGVTDMVRISDARMSGTAYGTVVLHTSPEAAVGGPLALVQNGDIDRPRRRRAPPASARQRRRARAPGARGQPPPPHANRGWVKLYCEHVLQADEGVDLDFLVGGSGAPVGRESH